MPHGCQSLCTTCKMYHTLAYLLAENIAGKPLITLDHYTVMA